MAFIQRISFDALEGPDDSTLEWKEEMDEKLQIEKIVKGVVERVALDADNLPVARVLFAEHEDDEELSDIEVSEEDRSERDYFSWIDTQCGDIRRCDVCLTNEWTIWERVRTVNGEPIDTLREHEGKLMCRCCQEMYDTPFSEYKCCCNCAISDKMGRRYGISMISARGSPEEYICSVCDDIYPDTRDGDYYDEDEDDVVSESEYEGWVQLLDGTWVLDRENDENVYEGEYENEDTPENNSEIAGEIKKTISEIGENLFNIQEKIKEGEYLVLMNLLQKVTNDVNRL